jgi:hypothetical protein
MDPNLCELCREIDICALGAYPDGDAKRTGINRTRAQLNDDCPLCQLFLDPHGPDPSEASPPRQVKHVSIEAGLDLDHGPNTFRSWLVSALRSWNPMSRAVEYSPLSRIAVDVLYEGYDFEIPMLLDVFVDQGKHHSLLLLLLLLLYTYLIGAFFAHLFSMQSLPRRRKASSLVE